jgi:hypothetical protein
VAQATDPDNAHQQPPRRIAAGGRRQAV